MRYLDVNHVYCDWMFAFFLLGWFVTRHFCFMIVIWSTIFDLPRLIPFRWEPENGFYVSNASIDTFIVCLVALQVCPYYPALVALADPNYTDHPDPLVLDYLSDRLESRRHW